MNNIETLGIRDVQAREPYTEVSVSYRGRRYVIRAVYTYKFNPPSLSTKLWSVHNGTMTRTYYRTLDTNLDFNEAITQKMFYEDMLNLIKEIDCLSGLREYYNSNDVPKKGVVIDNIIVSTHFFKQLKTNTPEFNETFMHASFNGIRGIAGIPIYVDDKYCKERNTDVVYIVKPVADPEAFETFIASYKALLGEQ